MNSIIRQSWWRYLLVGVSVMLVVAPLQAWVFAAPQTVVSLTFDDGLSSQTIAQSLLESHGMKGTFYVNSGRLDTAGHLSTMQVRGLQTAGHEVGGHTINHADLPTLTDAQKTVEICNDRTTLVNAGLTITDLAYPFGNYNAATERIAKNCGYKSARIVGDISCSGCDVAETIPPVDAFAIRTPDSIKSTTTLATMQSYITKAEATGGWVNLVIHNICNNCDTYSVSQAQLSSFLDWLQPRASRGTVVKTVNQVMTGTTTPPPPPPPVQQVLQNVSLETDANADKVPDCWQQGGYGTNTPVWSRVPDAHTGSWAEKLQMTSYTSGDAKLVSTQSIACAPTATTGKTYTGSAWYKSDKPVHLVAYYLDAGGVWRYWDESPNVAARTTYGQITWTTPAAPAAAVRLSIGLSLASTGTVTMDDFALSQN